ncbi:MAG: hypothetical protein ABC606_00785 [Candidatus Methanosuratincola petrocarbonis]
MKFKIIVNDSSLWRYNNIFEHYENYESGPIADLDFIVSLGDFIPSNTNCQIIENNYYIRKDYFYCKGDSYKFTKWSFEIFGLDKSSSLIKISSNASGYLWMCGFIIEFMLHYKLALKGYSIIHASGICDGNKGMIFSARGGGGKTTLALHSLENNFKLLGDNYIILHKGKILNYLTPLNIFYYNLAPIIKNNLTWKDILDLKLRSFLYKITNNYIKIFKKININTICPELVTNNVSASILILLIQGNNFNVKILNKICFCRHILYNQKLETLLFIPYIEAYSYVFPNSPLAKYWSFYLENLIHNLPDDAKFLLVTLPKQHLSKNIDKIMELTK